MIPTNNDSTNKSPTMKRVYSVSAIMVVTVWCFRLGSKMRMRIVAEIKAMRDKKQDSPKNC